MAIAARFRLTVIEDAAHAHAAVYNGRPAGSIGHLASFSFQSSKNMTSGEGGIIVSQDDELAERCRSIHNCGRLPEGVWYEHHVISGNYRLGELQGAVLNCQLDRLESQTRARDGNGRHLAARLAALPGLHPQARPASCTRHAYHLFMLRLDEAAFGAPRELVLRALDAEGIPCSAGYGFSLPDQPLFRNKAFGPYLNQVSAALDYGAARVPNSDRICRQAIWLEQNLLLGSRADADDIADAFEKIHAHRAALRGAAAQSTGAAG